MLRVLTALLICLAALAANAQSGPSVQWSFFQSGTSSKITGFSTRTIHTQGDWQSIWAQLTGQNGGTAPTGVDWNTDFLVLVNAGRRNTGGYKVAIESINLVNGGDLMVGYSEQTPDPKQMVSQAITGPWAVARVKRISFIELKTQKVAARTSGVKIIRGDSCGCGCTDSVCRCKPTCSSPCGHPIQYDVLLDGDICNQFVPTSLTLYSKGSFEFYWRNAFGNKDLPPSFRSVDWNLDVIVALHLGNKRCEGFGIEVSEVFQRKSGITSLRYFEIAPALGTSSNSMGVSKSPFLLVRVPRSAGIIAVEKLAGTAYRRD